METLRHSRTAAFTLIELLVVVAVIALLIGMLLPALAGARNAARSCKCLTQMRSLSQCAAMYADDHREFMPRSQHSAFSNHVAPWGYAFFEYLQGHAYTPQDPAWDTIFNGAYRCPMNQPSPRWSYGYNVYFELTPGENLGRVWNRVRLAPRPSATVLFGELLPTAGSDHAMAHFWTQYQAPPEIDPAQHGNSTGASFLDGHAQAGEFSSLFDPSRTVDRFNPATAR